MKDNIARITIFALVLGFAATGATAGDRVETPAPQTQSAATTIAETDTGAGFPVTAARDFILQAGYSSIVDLERVNELVWRGKASKEGQTYTVAVDYTGTVVGAN